MIERLYAARRWLVASVLVLAALAAGAAYAGHQDASVVSYTGCLNISGDSAGNVLKIKAGNSPLKPCGSGQVEFHFSGGDISAVRTPTGSGLTGGSENGAVTLGLTAQQKLPSCAQGNVPGWNGSAWDCYLAGQGLRAVPQHKDWEIDPSYQLPQACADGSLTVFDSGLHVWGCTPAYAAGQGLDLSSGNVFSIEDSYRLPQSCGNGQVAKSDGSGSWSCANDENSGLPPAFEDEAEAPINTTGSGATVLSKTIPSNAGGNYLIVAKVVMYNGDGDPQYADCTLRVNDSSVIDRAKVRNLPADDPLHIVGEGTLTLTELVTLGGGDKVSVHCGGFKSYALLRQLEIVRVGSLS